VIEQSSDITALAVALAKAQAQVKGAQKTEDNPFFKSKYADLASVWEACREPLTTNGLSVVQLPGYSEGVVTVDTMLIHVSGQWIRGTAGTKVSKDDPQGVGSAITYLRRYALAAVAGVAPEDDDGNAASGKSKERGGARTPVRTEPKEPVAPSPQPLDEKPKALATKEVMPWEVITAAGPVVWPYGAKKGTPLNDLTSAELLASQKWIERTGRGRELVDAIETILASRDGE